MTDRQILDFEGRFAERLQAFADIPVADVDELATARASIGSVGPRWLAGWLAPLRTVFAPVVLAGLLMLALLATIVAAGGVVDRLFANTPDATPHPLVDELAAATADEVNAGSVIGLADGRVLIVGGADTTVGQVTTDRAWLFDPATNQISETGSMNIARTEPLLALLGDGRVLVVGGLNIDEATEPVEGAELYDPAVGTFTRTANDPIARISAPLGALDHAWATPQITVLDDGRVVVSGGAKRGDTTSLVADVYDPSAGRFHEVEIGCDATRGGQVLLADGRLLVTCLPDRRSDILAAAIFDPSTDTFIPTGAPSTRANDLANLLPDGRVLFTGTGVNSDRGADLYDPPSGTFSTLEVSAMPDGLAPGLDIGGGRLLFLGLADPESPLPTLVFDSGAMAFHEIELPSLQLGEPTVQLADGRLFQVHYQLAATLVDPSHLP